MATSSPAEVHVLLVDDERVTRLVVGSLLRKCGYQGTRAHAPLPTFYNSPARSNGSSVQR